MQELPPKKDVALFFVQRTSVFVHLDPRSDDVIVPAAFKKEPQLVLQIGYQLEPPIPDLAFDDNGWSGTLSFRRVPFRCVVPWKSVFAMVTKEGRSAVWPDDVPPEVQKARPAPVPAKPALAPVPAPASEKTLEKVPEKASDKTPEKTAAAEKDEKKAASAKPKAKRAKKKLEAGEPTSESDAPVLAAAPAPAAPAPEPATAEPPAARPGKPKRELPHYIRVIK